MAPREPMSLQQLLPGVLAQVARETGCARQLKPLWDEVVGPAIARNSSPLALAGTALVVSVASLRWQAELSRREPELKERLQRKLGKGTVTRLVFRIAG